ncbi:MAG: hypothetical protein LBN07_04900 [Christensenellaceae bacterium]|jgi:hypothetical protein|nr:hypothetical protein [Christensenellaceae bacterium]
MEELDFVTLHKEKLALIFENIDILSAMKESDTQLPPKFFKEINHDVLKDYLLKIGILNKNTRFVIRELKKDFKLLRKQQKRKLNVLRKLRATETVIYALPAHLLHNDTRQAAKPLA